MKYLETIEDNVDELLQAVYVFALGSLVGVFGTFDVLPVLTDGPLFSLSGQFFALGDPAVDGTVITWAGGLAVLSGVVIYVTNLGIEALTEKPADFEVTDALLAAGVFGLPAIAVTDVFSLYSDYVAGNPVASVGLFVLGVVGVFLLADADKN